jgi:hypothetical protein
MMEAQIAGESMKKEQGCSAVMSAPIEASGNDVLNEVVQMTGLPADYLHAEINSFLGTGCEDVKDLSLDQLRSVLLNYLDTINDQMTQEQIKH